MLLTRETTKSFLPRPMTPMQVNKLQKICSDLKGLRRGSIIIAAVRDEASKNLSKEARAFFAKLGSKEAPQLGYREGWAFLGVKGQDNA